MTMTTHGLMDFNHPMATTEDAWLAELGGTYPVSPPEQIRPRGIIIDVTHKCPFRCPGCIEKKPMESSNHGELRVDTVWRIIRESSRQGVMELQLYGGEPTCYRWLPKIIRYASDHMKSIRVVTNGAYLGRADIVEAVRDATEQADVRVRVSLNAGAPQTHERLHGVGGFFSRVIENTARLFANAKCNGGVSFLVEELNAREVVQAYEIATQVGALDFWLRPKTGAHSVGLEPLAPDTKHTLLKGVSLIQERSCSAQYPEFHVPSWYLDFLKADRMPDTSKPYSACFFCGAARLVVTPPDPGLVWSCPYWRADSRFLVADLTKTPFGSQEFERRRVEATRRVRPSVECKGVICNRNHINKEAWGRLQSKRKKEVVTPHVPELPPAA